MDKFESTALPEAGRKDGYESALSAYFGDEYVDKNVRVEIGGPASFLASMEPLELGHLSGGVHMNNAPHRVFLSPIDTKSRDLDFYLLLNGDVAFEADSGPVHLRAGDMALLRTAEPVSSFSSQMEMIALHIPERLIRRGVDDRPLAIAQTVSGQARLGRCLGALLRAAAHRNDPLSFEEGLVFQSSIVDAVLKVAAIDSDPNDSALLQQEQKARLLKRSALSRINDPELSPQAVAAETGMSVRTVHRLFHWSGSTFRDWVRNQRLERCWEELSAPTPGRRTVADVAFRWGFNDLTTFNRSFRTKYGIAPTTLRAMRPTK